MLTCGRPSLLFGIALIGASAACLATPLEELRKGAELGQAECQCRLGWLYDTGTGLPQDQRLAREWYAKAAAQGYGRADLLLGLLSDDGHGFSPRNRESWACYRRAAEHGDADAQWFQVGVYQSGEGVEVDRDRAAAWGRKAAAAGHPEAKAYMGQEMPPSKEQAPKASASWEGPVAWCRQAAEAGNGRAQYKLGVIYYSGIGLQRSFAWSRHYLLKAAEQGVPEAQNAMGTMLMDPPDLYPADPVKAVSWFRKASVPLPAGQRNLGLALAEGKGVVQDLEEAARCFSRAAAQHDADAQFYLATLLQAGVGLPKDPARAIQLFTVSAEQGQLESILALGQILQSQGTALGDEKAVHLFRKGAEQNEARAQNNLGVAYVQGRGVKKDFAQAYLWFSLAKLAGNREALGNYVRLVDSLSTEERAEGDRLLLLAINKDQ